MGNCADKNAISAKEIIIKIQEPSLLEETVEFSSKICNEDDLLEGELKEFALTDQLSCLVAKQNGQIFAIGNQCSHNEKPLVKGVLGDGYVVCPWHGACFSLETGDIEDFPGLDSLPKYDVTVNDGEVKVHYKNTMTKRTKLMSKYFPELTPEIVVVIGGGPAAQECVETLRNRPEPFTGRIVMITDENFRPYDRTKLSKTLSMTAEEIALRPVEFYDEANIEIMTATEAVGLDLENKQIILISGDTLSYNYLVIATGCKPKTLEIPGSSATGIFVLQSPDDSNQISDMSEGKNVVIVGGSFVGLEVATSLADKAAKVTVIANGSYPFTSLGEKIGRYVQSLHEEMGIKFIFDSTPDEFLSDDEGQLTHVVVNGESIEADICLLGIGVQPSTSFLAECEIELDYHKNVIVNEFMETNVKDVFACGDMVSFPLNIASAKPGTMANIRHWQMAMAHGKCAGLNIGMEDMSPLKTVPFFWTVQCGKAIRCAGYAQGYDDIIYDGEVSTGIFVAYYCKGDEVVAVATLKRDPIASHFASLIRQGKVLAKIEALSEWFKND